MALNTRSHVIKKGGEGSSLSRVSPHVRLSNGSLTLFLQEGAVYSEDGKVLDADDFPEWLEEEVEKLSPEVRMAVGLAVQPKAHPTKPKQVSPRKK